VPAAFAFGKKLIIVAILAFALLLSPMAAALASPPIQRRMGLIVETIEGGEPSTVDYSIAYDTASGEILQNMMDTLVMFNGEHTNEWLPSIATSWIGQPLGPGGTGIDSGLPISGLLFENPDNQTGPNAKYYYRYTFEIRQGVFFQPPYNYSLTTEDVAFSFQRTMVMDIAAGPEWMLDELLLDIPIDTLEVTEGGLGGDLTNATQVAEIGALIQGAVQYNSTHVWFNLMFPSAYSPFTQILTQTWASIQSKQWINDIAIGVYGRNTWPGDWPDYTSWLAYRNPATDAYPLDVPFPIMYGSGPWIITTLDYTNSYWAGVRNEMYWRGWPADFPLLSAAKPAGMVDTIYITWVNVWANRLADFTAGLCDFCAVPRMNLAQVYKGGPPYNPNVPGGYYTLDGIRCVQPLPTLAVDAFFFTMEINPATLYGPITAANDFDVNSIPSDIFGNANWGIKVRQGFAQAFDFATFRSTAYLGEAMTPATAIVPGLAYYDASVLGWAYNLAAANASLNQVGPDSNGDYLRDVGFTLTLLWNTGNLPRQTACNLLATAIMSLNPRYTVNVVSISWSSYLHAAVVQQLPMYSIGWLADFPDPHNFALPFYRTGGAFSSWQAYSNATMDALIDSGILTADTDMTLSSPRGQIYHDIQVMAKQDCPSFTINQAIGRHFERDWVIGWYYNPVYPGGYYYNLWKWYYQAEAQLSTALNPPATTSALAGWNIPVDVNYDGKVDMKDVGTVSKAFGTSFGPPQDARWVFRGDINLDRKVDMKDIGLTSKQFGQNSAVWPWLYSNITAYVGSTLIANATVITITVASGTAVTFTEVLFGNTTTYTLINVDWQKSQWPGPLLEVQSGLSLTYTYTFTTVGTYYIYNDIVFTLPGLDPTSICEVAKVIVT